MAKAKQQTLETKIKFADEGAKDLFLKVLEENANNMVNIMNAMSVKLEYGVGDAKIEFAGDDISVYLRDKDKGTTLTADGYIPYSKLKEGDKYAVVKGGKPAVYTKSAKDVADVLIGYAPSLDVLKIELMNKVDLKNIIEKTS